MSDKKKKQIVDLLKEQIHQATLDQEKEKTQSLKYLLSILEKENYRQGELSEEKAIALLNGEMKRKNEALGLFEKGKRADLAEFEKQEIEWLKVFLPKALSEEEILQMVKKAVGKGSSFGQVMGQVMAQAQGRASGEQVTKIVKKELGN